MYYRDNVGLIWYAMLGANNITDAKLYDELTERSFKLKNFIIHDQYNAGQKYYDVGLIRLDEPVKLNSTINTVCLPKVILPNY